MHADRQNTPFELMFGESLVAILLSFESTKYLTIEDKMKTLLRNRQKALVAHELARSRMADQRRSTFTSFKKGDQVWIDSRNLKTIYHKKMKPKREGPFVITEVLGPVTYRLKLPTSWWIHNVFHQHYSNHAAFLWNYPLLPPCLDNLKHKFKWHQMEQYLIFDIDTGLMEYRPQKTRRYQFHTYTSLMSTSSSRWIPSHLVKLNNDIHKPHSDISAEHHRQPFNPSTIRSPSLSQPFNRELGMRVTLPMPQIVMK